MENELKGAFLKKKKNHDVPKKVKKEEDETFLSFGFYTRLRKYSKNFNSSSFVITVTDQDRLHKKKKVI